MKAIRPLFCFIFIINIGLAQAQDKYVKAGLIGMPLFQAGAILANAGFEYMNTDRSSWQINISCGIGQFAADLNTTTRKWITFDRTYYIRNEKPHSKRTFYSFFVEAGTRKIAPGNISTDGDSIIKSWHSSEICPGIAIGKNFSMGRKLHLEILGGPKAILAFHNDQYYRKSSNSNFHTKYNDIRAGFRFLINVCYPL